MTGGLLPDADDSKSLSSQIRQMAMDTLPEGERQAGRVEVLPVQWRKHLKLEVRPILYTLDPPGARSLRSLAQ